MGVLGLYMVIGFVIGKIGIVDKSATRILSKLENNIFLPALVMYTFLQNFTTTTLSTSWQPLLFALGTELIIIPIAMICSKLVTKDDFIRRMYIYGLSFANFGFMGNAVVQTLFSAQFYQAYVIFTIPLWTLIYVWGVPTLLMERKEGDGPVTRKSKVLATLKSLANPMFIALIIGAIIGITGLGNTLLSMNGGKGFFALQVIKVCGDCMSPIAMIMTGITFAFIDIKKVLKDFSIYIVTALRLIVFPLVLGGIVYFINAFIVSVPDTIYKCFIITLAMPLGLNTIVVPAAYGRDTSIPAGMALVSHTLSIATIPLIMMIFGIG